MEQNLSPDRLQAEIADLKKLLDTSLTDLNATKAELQETAYQLEEANDMIEAIRGGELDALVLKTSDGHQLYTLSTSDQAYRIFIEQMTAGAVTLNRNGNILYSNSRFAEMAGLPLEKVTGRTFCELVHPDQIDRYQKTLAEAWNNGVKKEFTLDKVDGAYMPVLLSMQTLDLAEGVSMSIIITDLSQQKQQQKLLEEKNIALEQAQRLTDELNGNLELTVKERTKELYANQERLSRILETMAEGVVITDVKGKLTYANVMAKKILGISLSDLKTNSYDDPQWTNLRVDGSPLPSDEHPLAIVIANGKPVYDHEIAIQPPNADRFYISINAAAIRDENGQLTAVIGTFMDVSHRRKAIQQKDEFISVASHELRTPLTSLKASLQLLDRMKDAPNLTVLPKLISQSNKSLNKVSILVDDLLNTTKLSEGQLALNKSTFKIAELVSECCAHIRSEGTFTLTETGDKNLQVEADMDKIEQVLVNLVNNAVKYAPNSKIIHISYFRENDQLIRISVTDYGPGIPEDKLPHLFERYYRVDNGDYQYSGLGLGLYISFEIIRKHSGQMGVESQLGKGSTFWFTLPL